MNIKQALKTLEIYNEWRRTGEGAYLQDILNENMEHALGWLPLPEVSQ